MGGGGFGVCVDEEIRNCVLEIGKHFGLQSEEKLWSVLMVIYGMWWVALQC